MKPNVLRWFGRIWKLLPSSIRVNLTRAAQQTFTASVVAVVTNKSNEVLILDHVLRPASGWGLPGGFIDASEQPEDAVRRELMEEVGIGLEDLKFELIRNRGRHIEVIYSARVEGVARVMSSEISQLGWFALDQLPDEMNSEQKRLIRSILSNKV